ncbi:lysine--tRNA ligase [Candidatus Roizmanbacteria bacterium]|nr:lysine--tRNA ligase [Candidatus Roizmanbacteria bacterium]
MIWVDREAKQIKERKLSLEWVDDMKTPSGRIHVGALRGVVIHDSLYKALLEHEIPAKFTYIFDDHDPMDAIPAYLEFEKWEQYAGMQLYRVPSPEKGYDNFAQYYAKEFIEVFESINCHPEIIWGSDLYNSGKMNDVVKEVLDNANVVRKIYRKVADAKKPRDWYPFHAICEKCQKVGTTTVYKWDGTYVYYRCVPQMVAWAKGCSHEGKISPYNGTGKLPWKVEWPAKWKVLGVTIEGAGKDHMSAGGSHDIAKAICEQVLHYPVPHAIPYEWFTIGGKKMSTSKGIGSTAIAVSQILPSEVFRFLIVRTPIGTALDFNPYGDTIPNLFDDYDRCLNAHFDKLEGKIPEGKPGEVLHDFARIAQLSEVKPLPEKRIYLPRFRTIVNVIKSKADVLSFFENHKGSALTEEEKGILEERAVYAQVYLKNYAQKEEEVKFTQSIPEGFSPTENQKLFLKKLAESLKKQKTIDRERLQTIIFDTLKENGIPAKEVFPAFYQVLIGKEFGPKAADLILEFSVKKVVKRLLEVK